MNKIKLMAVEVKERVERSYKGRISVSQLRDAFDIPTGAMVSIHVPSGGNYSGQDLEIGIEISCIDVQWTEKETK